MTQDSWGNPSRYRIKQMLFVGEEYCSLTECRTIGDPIDYFGSSSLGRNARQGIVALEGTSLRFVFRNAVFIVNSFAIVAKPECRPKNIVLVYFNADPLRLKLLSYSSDYVASVKRINNDVARICQKFAKKFRNCLNKTRWMHL